MINKIRAFLGLNYYTSELDQFISDFRHDRGHLSASQRKEVEKYNQLNKTRDNPDAVQITKKSFWDKF